LYSEQQVKNPLHRFSKVRQIMNTDFENRYLDVLQNMETMIVQVYRDDAELSDFEVDKALEGLLRTYQAEQRGKPAPTLKLGERDKRVYDDVLMVCQVRLGRAPMAGTDKAIEPDSLTVDEIIACIKRLRASVSLWTKEYGRKGYLDYVNPFLP
jgi:hypothetical protein